MKYTLGNFAHSYIFLNQHKTLNNLYLINEVLPKSFIDQVLMDDIIYGIFKVQYDFALEVWFSIL